jgi:iron complex transport system substrate-binding protein
MKKLHFYLLFTALFALIETLFGSEKDLCQELRNLEEVKLKYAEHFKILKSKTNSLLLTKGQAFLRGSPPPANCLKKNFFYLGAKTLKFAADSTSVYPWFEKLEVKEALVAFSQKEYLQIPKSEAQKLRELGTPVKAEVLLGNHIDIFFSSSSQNLTAPSLFLLHDFEESHPLGRAEWIKTLAFFVGKEASAQTFFDHIEKEYLETLSLIKGLKAKKVLIGEFVDQVFFAPAPISYLAKIVADAGGDYYFRTRKDSSTIKLKKEEMILDLKDQDLIYLPQNHKALAELKLGFEPLKLSGIQVFNNNKRLKSSANDYWQNGVNSPHLLLKDLIKIFHPEVLPLHEFIWYQELK